MYPSRNTFLKFILAFFSTLYFPDCKSVKASHAMGADLTYECLGNNQYRLNYSFYRDCSGISAPTSISVQIVSSCFPTPFSINLTPTPLSPNEISPTCPTAPNTCHGGSLTGIQEWIYTGIVTLPGPCADWKFSHSESYRNIAITTINNPNTSNLYVYSLLNNTDCSTNGTASVSVSGGVPPYRYNWSTTATVSGITGLAAGLYSVIVTDANNCTATNSLAVSSPGGSTITLVNSDTLVCHGQSTGFLDIQVSGGNGPYSFNWSNGAITEDISLLAAGTYIVSVRDAGQCVSTASFVVHDRPDINETAGSNNPVCAGSIINLSSSGVGATGYSWIGPNGFTSALQNPSFNTSINDSGIYTVIISNASGCSDTARVHVTVNSCNCTPPTLAEAHKNISCFGGNDGSIDIAAIGGNPPYNYSWTGGLLGRSVSGLIAGAYTVTVSDANGCFSQLTITITQPLLLSVSSTSITDNLCANANQGSISVLANGGTSPYSYLWNNGKRGASISQLDSGSYNVTVSDQRGCTTQNSFNVSSPSPLSLILSGTNDNCGNGTGTCSALVSGGVAPYVYLWPSGATTAMITGQINDFIPITVSDANGCTISDYADISSLGGPAIALVSIVNAGCYGQSNGSIDIQVNGGLAPYQYKWSNGSTLQDVTGLAAGKYHVSVRGANGCASTTFFNITESAQINAVAMADDTVCTGSTLNLFGSGGIAYAWTGPNAFSSALQNPSFTALAAHSGTYTLTVSDAASCSNSTSVNVIVKSCPCVKPIVAQAHINNLCDAGNNASINLAIAGGASPYSYAWTSGQTTINISGLIGATYTVTVTDAISCTATLSIAVVDPNPVSITAPVVVNNICASGTTGSISVTPTGGTAPYFYQWSNGSGNSSISQLDTGQYSLTVSDANGCSSNRNFAVGAASSLSLQMNSTAVSCCVPQPCNNSPVFSNKPVPFACVGQRFCFNHGASDPDGDSLSYQLITPLTDANTPVIYQSGFSNTQPVLSSPPVTFNQATGDICMLPSQADVSVFAVLVNEYRNGVLIGQVERDIQITVLNCNNYIPDVTGINITPAYTANICAETPFCFDIKSVDADVPADSTFITWDNAIPGATLTTDGAQKQAARFCWTPSLNDVSTTPHCFTVTVKDNHCPYIGTQVHSYCLTVRQVCADAGTDQTIPCGTVAQLNGTGSCGLGNYTYSWRIDSTTIAIPGQSISDSCGSYILTVNDSSAIPGIPMTYQRCYNYDTVNVVCLGAPVAAFTASNVCSNAPVQFTDLSTGTSINSWEWDFGDGNNSSLQNPSHQYLSGGTYQVSLRTCAGQCCNTSTQSIHVDSIPQANFSLQNECEGITVAFAGQASGGPITAWQWNFDDPASGNNISAIQNSSHLFSDSGTFSVQLIVSTSGGCNDTLKKSISIFAAPQIAISDTSLCKGSSIDLLAPAGFAGYQWNTGDTTASINVNPSVTTQYTLSVSDLNQCLGYDSINVVVKPLLIANAGNDFGICEGNNAVLNGSGGGVTALYTWTPGGIGQSIQVNPAVTTQYTLVITEQGACSGSSMVTVSVNPTPTLSLVDELGICKGDSVLISPSSNASHFVWTPGPYSTSIISVSPGITTTYFLNVSDDNGCAKSDSVKVNVHMLPHAAVGGDQSACQDSPLQLTDLSVSPEDSIQSWLWVFGNGNTANSADPLVTFQQYGNYNVKLIVTTTEGCSDSINKSIDIWALPYADFLFNEVCDGSPIQFSNISTIDDGSSLALQWEFDATNGSTNPSPSFTFGSDGNYPVSLIATSSHACSDSIDQTVRVHAFPNASFTNYNGCENQTVPFIDQSTVVNDVINYWNWDFGDGGSSSDQNSTHSYSSAATYPITLIVKSDFGCPDTTHSLVMIAPSPIPAFFAFDNCFGIPTQIINTSDTSSVPIQSYQWDFGDGTSYSGIYPNHQYLSSGTYDISLTVTAANGCIETFFQSNAATVFEEHPTNFLSDLGATSDIYPSVTFRNLTSSVLSSLWNFGDGTASTDFSPIHIYPGVGVYKIQLFTVDINGCMDSTTSTVEINNSSAIFIPNTFTPNADLKNDVFRVYTYNILDLEVQIFDRWGLLIYEWDNIGGGWNGKLNGNPVQDDVYVYRISSTDINNKHKVQYGKVSIVY